MTSTDLIALDKIFYPSENSNSGASQTETKSQPQTIKAKSPNGNPSTNQTSWLLRFFESKHFDMSIAIGYIYNTKEPGVQTYLVNRLFTFPNEDVDFYLPQLLNIYIYMKDLADLLNPYFRHRCCTSVDFSLRCAWLLESFINDNKKESRKVSYAIKLHKLIVSERLKPVHDNLNSSKCGFLNSLNGDCVREESPMINNETPAITNHGHVLPNTMPTAVTSRAHAHSRTRSDTTAITNSLLQTRSMSLTSLKSFIGDLMSGKAFDNNCVCFDLAALSTNGFNDDTKLSLKLSSNNTGLTNGDTSKKQCICNAPRLAPEFELTKALISIGKKLVQLPTKELKSILSSFPLFNSILPSVG
jgi:hypothetical protein